jgi:putative membrane-bound dehydrogenase-like protein
MNSHRFVRFLARVAPSGIVLVLLGAMSGTTAPAAPPLPQPRPDWKIEVVAEAPKINHPSVVACAPDGRVFVAEDPMDISLPKADVAEGRILCVHPDGRITLFAVNLHAVFGMQYLEGRLYVVHSPKFSVFRDDQGIGRDRIDLIESLNPNPWALDWNDHVPANLRLAMDGHFYMAVGDKGAYGAVGRDGKRIDLHGGGILRLRPDGTGLEVYCTGVRNILDVAINAEDELFTYDNTDEQQWMSRLTHMVDGGFYGYPYDFIPRRPYTLWMMADYGGGAATGAFCYNEDALPREYQGNLFLADFGKRQLLRVRLERDGASYKVVSREDLFADPPDDFRPVGIALAPDGLGIYLCDWQHRDTKENVSVGRLLKLSYRDRSNAAPKPDWYLPAALGKKFEASAEELIKGLLHPAQSVRLVAQRRIVDRFSDAAGAGLGTAKRRALNNAPSATGIGELTRLLADPIAPPYARWHALWTLDAFDHDELARKAIAAAANDADPGVRRQAIRQLGTARARDATQIVVSKLKDGEAAVRFQAATALGRIGEPSAIPALLNALAEEDLFARYAVFTALNRIGRADGRSWPVIAQGLESDQARVREGTVFALRETSELPLVRALAELVHAPAKAAEARAKAVELLAAVHRKKPEWKGEWWAYHPVNAPPPANSEEWNGSEIVRAILSQALDDRELRVRLAAVDGAGEIKLAGACPRLRDMFRKDTDVELKGRILAALGALEDKASAELLADVFAGANTESALLPDAIAAAGQIGSPETGALIVKFLNSRPADKAILLQAIGALGKFKRDDAIAALAVFVRNDDAEVRQGAIAALTRIGGDSAAAAFLSLLDGPSADIRRGAVIALGELKARSAVPQLLKASRDGETKWEAIAALARMPDARALGAYLDGLGGRSPALRTDCRKAIEAIGDKALPAIEAGLNGLAPETVAELQMIYAKNSEAKKGRLFEAQAKKLEPAGYLEFALKHDGDAARGRTIFRDASGVACIKCHRVAGEGGDVGPDLTTAGTQFGRAELAESILYPSKAIREGYQRVEVETKNDETFEGLVKAESNEWLTLRDASGTNRQISKADIKDRRNSQLSLMPEGLETGMPLQDFTDLVAYLVSLKGRP